jgi:N-acylneuraminate cytidylyltransferase
MASDLDPCLAVIPARGGSKGLPGKNVRPLAGLPLLVHALRCAERVPRIRRTVVSTDSEEIAAVARAGGGEVPFLRPAELAGDRTPTIPVLQHALAELERRDGVRYGSLLLLEPTSPGRLPEDVERAFALLDANPAADGVVACSRPHFNPLYVGVVQKDGYLARAFDGAAHVRRQDVPDFFRITGALYLWRREFLARTGPVWMEGRHLLLEIPELRAFSIDDAQDFAMAELAVTGGLVKLPWLP